MVWLNPKHLFRMEPIFLMLSFVTAAWFAFGCCWAYFSSWSTVAWSLARAVTRCSGADGGGEQCPTKGW